MSICLFQQFSLVLDWWVPVEARHKLGFSSRIMMTPNSRAIMSKETGLMEADTVRSLMQLIWNHAAQHWGPSGKHQTWLLQTPTAAQQATRSFYYKLNEEEKPEGCGSACKSALGKMEYHMPRRVTLTSLAEQALLGGETSDTLSDSAVKCGVPHFDLRVFQCCAIIDSEVKRQPTATAGKKAGPRESRSPLTNVLIKRPKDPMQLSEISRRVAALRGNDNYAKQVCPSRIGAAAAWRGQGDKIDGWHQREGYCIF